MLTAARARAALRGRLARIPFRARLAAAFGGLFLLAGAGLLGLVVLLARRGITQRLDAIEVSGGDAQPGDGQSMSPTEPSPSAASTAPDAGVTVPSGDGIALRKVVLNAAQSVSDTAVQQIVLWSGIGLLIMTALSALLGWWLAGRALRPVAAVTDAARSISEQNLHERLRLTDPDDELHRLADTFDTMLDRLEKSFDSQRRFVANASHELRTRSPCSAPCSKSASPTRCRPVSPTYAKTS